VQQGRETAVGAWRRGALRADPPNDKWIEGMDSGGARNSLGSHRLAACRRPGVAGRVRRDVDGMSNLTYRGC
jgi:hypothetical protein